LSLRDIEELLFERGVVVGCARKEVPQGRDNPELVRHVWPENAHSVKA
jgi:hypothetical protein